MKNNDIIERYKYLEKWLKENYPLNMTDEKVIKYFRKNFKDEEDIKYLFSAYLLPYEMINRFIKVCDNNEKRVIKFARQMANNYSELSTKQVLNRFKIVKLMDSKKKIEKTVVKRVNTSKMIDNYLLKNNGDLLDRKVILEGIIDDIKFDGLSDKEIYNIFRKSFNDNDSLYLMRAYKMPMKEILKDIRSAGVPEHLLGGYIKNTLVPKYNTDVIDIYERIEEAVFIEHYQKREEKAKSRIKK